MESRSSETRRKKSQITRELQNLHIGSGNETFGVPDRDSIAVPHIDSTMRVTRSRSIKLADVTVPPPAPQPVAEEPERKWTTEDFDIGKPLGRGAFGRVYLARTRKEHFIVALKVLFKQQLVESRVESNFRREIEINARLKHKNILSMFGFFWDEKRIYLILEYAPNGELFKILRERGHFNEQESASYVAELVDALIYCHSRSVIHRDIKPENLLLGGFGELKLADFGWSVHAPSSKRRTVCGTTDYLAPELVNKTCYDATIDIWCVGVLLFEFLYGAPPFETTPHNEKETHRLINKCIFTIDPNFISPEPARLIRAMLKPKGKDRMPLEQLKNEAWIVKNRLEKTEIILPGDEEKNSSD